MNVKHLLFGLVEAIFLRAFAWMGNTGIVLCLNIYSQRTYDNSLLLKAAGLVAASADGTLILDVGTGMFNFDLILDVTALEVATGDEGYRVVIEGSPDALFGTAGNIVPLCEYTVGSATGAAPLGTADGVGRFLCPGRNERNGTTYRYLRLRTVVVGTIATGINFTAWLAKREQ